MLRFQPVGQLTGIEVRHAKACASRDGGRCNCRPTYQGSVWSPRDEKRLRKTFPTLTAARAWRAEAQTAVRRGAMRAPAATTVREAAGELIEGMRSGRVRTRSGDRYKPSAIRSYEASAPTAFPPMRSASGGCGCSSWGRRRLRLPGCRERGHAASKPSSTAPNARPRWPSGTLRGSDAYSRPRRPEPRRGWRREERIVRCVTSRRRGPQGRLQCLSRGPRGILGFRGVRRHPAV